MRKPILIAALSIAGFVSTPANAAIFVNFEGIANYPTNSGIGVLNFYNGGTASNGHTNPTNLGVSFASSALTLCLNTAAQACSMTSHGGVGNPASAFTGMFFNYGTSTFLNVAAGFNTGLNFFYAANTMPGSVRVYSGTGGTGTLLASLNLGVNSSACGAPFNATNCNFGLVNLPFNGTAHSVVFGGTANRIVFDDITLGQLMLPEPGTWTTMIVGFGLIGAALRRRRREALA